MSGAESAPDAFQMIIVGFLVLAVLLLWQYMHGKRNDEVQARVEAEPVAIRVGDRSGTPPEARRPSQVDNRPPPLELSPSEEPMMSRSAHFSAVPPSTQQPEQQSPPSPAVSQEDDVLALGQLLEFQKLLVNRGLVLQRIKLSSRTEGKTGAPKERVLMMHRVDAKADREGRQGDHRIDDVVYLQWTTRSHGWGLRKMIRQPRRLLLQGLEVREVYRDSSSVKRLRPGLPAEKSFNAASVPSALSAKLALRSAVSRVGRVKEPDKVLCLVLSFRDGPHSDTYEVQAASDVELRWISKMLKGLVKVKEEATVDAEFDAKLYMRSEVGDDDYSVDGLSSTAESVNTVTPGASHSHGQPCAGGSSILSASAGGAPRYRRVPAQTSAFFHVPLSPLTPTDPHAPS